MNIKIIDKEGNEYKGKLKSINLCKDIRTNEEFYQIRIDNVVTLGVEDKNNLYSELIIIEKPINYEKN